MASEVPKQLICTARVQITIELDCGQPWGADCAMGQVFDQAASDVVNRVRQKFGTLTTIIGEPVVTAFVVKR